MKYGNIIDINFFASDLPTPGKEKSGDSWKKSEDSTKSSEILFSEALFPLGGGGRVHIYLLKYYLALFVVIR